MNNTNVCCSCNDSFENKYVRVIHQCRQCLSLTCFDCVRIVILQSQWEKFCKRCITDCELCVGCFHVKHPT